MQSNTVSSVVQPESDSASAAVEANVSERPSGVVDGRSFADQNLATFYPPPHTRMRDPSDVSVCEKPENIQNLAHCVIPDLTEQTRGAGVLRSPQIGRVQQRVQ